MDLAMVRGDTPSWELSFSRGGAPIDLVAGSLIWMSAKRALTDIDSAAVFKKSIGSGVTITDAPNGVAVVDLLAADTSTLPDTDITLYYDVQLKELSGRITTMCGKLHVTCDVTELVS
jgi:hypothetical protein